MDPLGVTVQAMNSVELTALLVLATVASFSPGPNTTLSTALAANLGLRRAMRFVLAVPVGWGLLLIPVVTKVIGPIWAKITGKAKVAH